MNKTLNAKGRPFSWSFTVLQNYEGCPARYAAEKFYCTTVWVDTPQILWGNRVHTANEQFLKRIPVAEPEVVEYSQPYLNALMDAPKLNMYVEREIALTEDLRRTKWFAKDAWFRMKMDVVILKKKFHLNIYDWKTGKFKDNPDQLKMSCAAWSCVDPHIEVYTPKFIWLKEKTISGLGVPEMITRAEIPGIWAGILGRVARMQEAWDTETFPARPSFLCPWCAQYETCPNARRR
ncbi:PD-(D/E)XK nuclease family protein [Candidatus Pacearchaeota archaeon]|nr:PD-(D/E)XK nuclease family protein [Candidatus Pacearchaeota archaeon]